MIWVELLHLFQRGLRKRLQTTIRHNREKPEARDPGIHRLWIVFQRGGGEGKRRLHSRRAIQVTVKVGERHDDTRYAGQPEIERELEEIVENRSHLLVVAFGLPDGFQGFVIAIFRSSAVDHCLLRLLSPRKSL